ncbi:zinc finger protein 287 [Hippoglossus stenolepis]|uniref:zinc finger protein 287 n=1 Tax=Hippoglossus stenolepis TaxID=195615 RepID=UPI00159BFB8D|nr:zinc finger protein 287 [Hippoglossus stenolepis]
MSADVVNLQAQVESVLVALVKAATVELTKLFESRYRASPAVAAGRTEDQREHDTLGTPAGSSAADTKRSVGVQVDGVIYPQLELPGPPFLSNGDCLTECNEELAVVEGRPIPSEILLAGDYDHVDPKWSPLKEKLLAKTVDMVELSVLEPESPADSESKTEIVLHVCTDTTMQNSTTTTQKPLDILPDTSDITSEKNVKFVCPLKLKPEPQQTCVSTAQGTAYSPSPSDGALHVRVWEQFQAPKETKNSLQMKLKLTSPDQKLLSPCVVQLVDVLMVPLSEAKLQDDVANRKAGWRLPKDLRRHQGLHTGHRLCCFTPCDNGIWRLQTVVTHSREGYTCSVCGKTFKHRKILRRHERFHTGDKPYPCSVCSKTFALRKSLRRHFRFHNGERPHTCTQCSKSFRLRENLKSHLRFHSGEKPFSCSTCGKMFRIMRNLEKHNLSQCGYFVPSFKTLAGM